MRPLYLCIMLLIVPLATAADREVAPAPRPGRVGELVRRLGSDRFDDRQRAADELAAYSFVPPELRAATRSPDPDVAHWANDAATRLRKRAYGPISRGVAFADAGAVDRFIAATATWAIAADEDDRWQPVLDLAHAVAGRAGFTAWPPRGGDWEWRTVDQVRRTCHPRFIAITGHYETPYRRLPPPNDRTPPAAIPEVLSAASLSAARAMGANVLVSRGPVQVGTVVQQSVVLANGDVAVGDNLFRAIVVADGDITVGGHASLCLLVARGRVTVGGTYHDSVLAAGGVVAATQGTAVDVDMPSTVRPNEPRPFGFVTFFELSQVGLGAEAADKAVRVTKVDGKSPVAAAGLAVGDVVTAVDKHTVATPEELRRRLRDAWATAGTAALDVRRDGRPHRLTLAFPDP